MLVAHLAMQDIGPNDLLHIWTQTTVMTTNAAGIAL